MYGSLGGRSTQMQWTLQGAHLVLQARTKALNNELEDVFFRRWYPRFRPKGQNHQSRAKRRLTPGFLALSFTTPLSDPVHRFGGANSRGSVDRQIQSLTA